MESATPNPKPAASDDTHPAWSPLSIHDMTVAYHRQPVLWDIDYDAPPGKLIAIVGPNGAGKSTMIKAALNLVPKIAGSVAVFGEPYRKQRGRVGYVPQRSSVDWDFPVNALEAVTMGLYRKIGWFRPVRKAHRQLAMKALVRVGMQDFAMRQISQLSGGQQQRVFLARALAQDSDLYLMDEPFAGVDPVAVEDIQRIVAHLKKKNIGILITDHNVQETLAITDKTYLMFEGSILKAGTPDELASDEMVRKVYLGQNFELRKKKLSF